MANPSGEDPVNGPGAVSGRRLLEYLQVFAWLWAIFIALVREGSDRLTFLAALFPFPIGWGRPPVNEVAISIAEFEAGVFARERTVEDSIASANRPRTLGGSAEPLETIPRRLSFFDTAWAEYNALISERQDTGATSDELRFLALERAAAEFADFYGQNFTVHQARAARLGPGATQSLAPDPFNFGGMSTEQERARQARGAPTEFSDRPTQGHQQRTQDAHAEFERREYMTAVVTNLNHPEMLMIHALARNEGMRSTRAHFEDILCGFEDPASTSRTTGNFPRPTYSALNGSNVGHVGPVEVSENADAETKPEERRGEEGGA